MARKPRWAPSLQWPPAEKIIFFQRDSSVITSHNILSGPNGSRPSSEQHPKDVNSKKIKLLFTRAGVFFLRDTPES